MNQCKKIVGVVFTPKNVNCVLHQLPICVAKVLNKSIILMYYFMTH